MSFLLATKFAKTAFNVETVFQQVQTPLDFYGMVLLRNNPPLQVEGDYFFRLKPGLIDFQNNFPAAGGQINFVAFRFFGVSGSFVLLKC
ncbi:hypothetical protein A8F94_14010 [Bacillus sp. FJAT-27225]|nr:hypothetical protein A8F94_14010 [Bacillus sp. FJAT-27225]